MRTKREMYSIEKPGEAIARPVSKKLGGVDCNGPSHVIVRCKDMISCMMSGCVPRYVWVRGNDRPSDLDLTGNHTGEERRRLKRTRASILRVSSTLCLMDIERNIQRFEAWSPQTGWICVIKVSQQLLSRRKMDIHGGYKHTNKKGAVRAIHV